MLRNPLYLAEKKRTFDWQFYEFRREISTKFYDYRRMLKKELASVFGKRLRQARKRAGLPQDKLGVQIGLDEHTASARISRYEAGIHEPPYAITVKLAEALMVPASYFYAEDDRLAYVVQVWGEMSFDERARLAEYLEVLRGGR
ncbi:helix-turn-helix domain-containing protein [Massilia eburnea]|uniref:helix-turn-helix domain-containing protein n=1 Tax=Massilia eburnea TaxID=1776165 RepID=UPI003D6A1751